MAEQLDALRNPLFDPQKSVILSRAAGVVPKKLGSLQIFDSKVESISADANGYRFHTLTTAPAVLVVSQTYYPGWKAFVDGHEVPVFDADYALTGFALPEGTHDVRFIFYSPTFRVGLILTSISAVILGWMGFRRIITPIFSPCERL